MTEERLQAPLEPTGSGRFSRSSRVVRKETAIGEAALDDFLILDLSTGSYYGVGAVGGFAWTRFGAETALEEIAREIARDFAVDPATALADLLDLTGELWAVGLIEE